MKKKKAPRKKQEKYSFRFTTKLMILSILLLILTVAGIGYRLFYMPTSIQLKLSKKANLERERERQRNEDADSKSFSYSPADSESNTDPGKVLDENSAMDALEKAADDMSIADPRDNYRLASHEEGKDYTSYKFNQYYNGIRVYGYGLTMEVDSKGNVQDINGDHPDLSGLNTDCEVSSYDAGDILSAHLEKNGRNGFDDNLPYAEKIIYNHEGQFRVGYLFESDFRRVIINGQTGAIDSDMDTMIFDMELRGQLHGQNQGMQTLDYWKSDDTTFELRDNNREISVYQNSKTNSILSGQIAQANSEDCQTGVDALANVQKCYDYFASLGKIGLADEELKIILNMDNWGYNAAMNGPGTRLYVSSKQGHATTYAYNLDVIGHEYTHGVVNTESSLSDFELPYGYNAQCSINFAINEGIADIFGETIEYYNSGQRADWDWNLISRTLYEPSNGQLTDARDYKEGKKPDDIYDVTVGTDCHDGTYLLSHPAYLMFHGPDPDKNITVEQMTEVWYYIIRQLKGGSKFKHVRKYAETWAINHRGSVLTDLQVEGILDAFDSTGIEPTYILKGTPGSVLRVYDVENELYDNYHLSVSFEKGEEVISEDVHDKTYQLALVPGIYKLVITDLEDETMSKSYSMIVNDNDQSASYHDYQDDISCYTSFGIKEREVVLAIDVSGSMSGTPISETRNAAINFVNTVLDYNPKTKITLVTYSDSASTVTHKSSDRSSLISHIRDLSSGGSTNIHDALRTAKSAIASSKAKKKIIILMSDGYPETGEQENGDYVPPILRAATDIKNSNILLYTLGFFHKQDGETLGKCKSLMASIASPGNNYDVASSDSIQYVLDDLGQQLSGDPYIYIRIACPVDVKVTKNGETLDSKEVEVSERARMGTLCFEDASKEVKLLRLNASDDYEICITGNGEGTMDYSISYPDKDGEYTDVRTFEKIPIREGSLISTGTKQSLDTRLLLDVNGDGVYERDYVAMKNGKGQARLMMILRLLLGILIIITAIKIVFFIRKYIRFKANKANTGSSFCEHCGAPIPKGSRFCGICGNAIEPEVSFLQSLKKNYRPVNNAVRVLQITIISLCVLCLVLTIGFYKSAPLTAYRQIQDCEYVSAQNIYEKNLRSSDFGNRVFEKLLSYHLDRVKKGTSRGHIEPDRARELYETVINLDMGSCSETAQDLLTKIKN